MPIRRVFLDWTRPALPEVVSRLIDEYSAGDEIDLSRVIVVVPGKRAGRRLRELLTDRTGGRCRPPRVITINELPELLYEPKFPFASDLVQKLAWAEALRTMGAGELQGLIHTLPAQADAAGWLALAELLWQQAESSGGAFRQ